MRKNILQALLILFIVGISIQIVHATLTSVTVQVSGSDIPTTSKDFDPAAAATYILNGIPQGTNRTVVIIGKDEDGYIIFTGTHNITIIEDIITQLHLYDMEVALGVSASRALTAAHGHSLALKSDGNIWGWGLNSSGQLGDGSIADSTIPHKSKLVTVTGIDAGFDHSVALKYDGTVWTWGYNESGQLGNGKSGSSEYENIPVKVMNPDDLTLPFSNVTAVAAGDFHTVALKSDGTVWTWGYNLFGQLGDNSTTDRDNPVQVFQAFSTVAAISAGSLHSIAMKNDGTLWAWGINESGQLGNGTQTDSAFPVFSNLSTVKAVASGGYHNIALKTDGTVWTWGDNEYGQLGNDKDGDGNSATTDAFENTPVQVFGNFSGVQAVAGGNGHTIALKSDNTVWTWGYNDFGQLCNGKNGDGNPDTPSSLDCDSDDDCENAPVKIMDPDNPSEPLYATAIAAGFRHTLLMKSDGTVWSCGWNEYGQLGDGTGGTGNISNVPVQVLDLDLR